MRFYEHESKALFARHGLPLGRRGLAKSASEASRIAGEIGGPVVLKSQVLSGGRMKAGAVAKHAAVLSEGRFGEAGAKIVHAYWGRAVVESWLGPFWTRHAVAGFRFP